jgi:diguanylate cyclase (GGDEF)-like protein
MPALTRDQSFETQHRELEERHRRLLELIDRLGALPAERGEAEQVLRRLHGELTAAVAELFERAAARDRELEARVEQLAMTDSLTGLPNRRYAMLRLTSAWAAAVRHGRALACLMVDADGFKQVNDTGGHDAGDQVLLKLAQALRSAVRESDEVCRLGGDEFVVLCPETSLEGALVLGERLRAAAAALHLPFPGGAWCGGVSVGAAAYQSWMVSAEDLLRAADAGVEEARRQGRNCVAAAAAVDAPKRG